MRRGATGLRSTKCTLIAAVAGTDGADAGLLEGAQRERENVVERADQPPSTASSVAERTPNDRMATGEGPRRS